uniref:Uncharacterized protein n=1 Tax=Oryza brachyantha TaxID=4533 RepID=J3LVK3_ORYBR
PLLATQGQRVIKHKFNSIRYNSLSLIAYTHTYSLSLSLYCDLNIFPFLLSSFFHSITFKICSKDWEFGKGDVNYCYSCLE